MWKFVVVRIKGNDEEIIKCCESKDEAVVFGGEYYKALPKGGGIVSVEEIELGQHGQLIDGYKKVHHVWY